MKKIIVVEDDLSILTGIEYALSKEGYEVITCDDGVKALTLIRQEMKTSEPPVLIILDVMLPKKNGYEICEALRKDGCKVIILMLTAKSQEKDKLAGFNCGADDYVTKPFSVKELLARVAAHLRRLEYAKQNQTPAKRVKINNQCCIDFEKHEIKNNKKVEYISAREGKLLEYFCANKGKVIERLEILQKVWAYDELNEMPTTRTVDNYIVKIRQIIEKDPNTPQHLKTIYGKGYRFDY